MALSGPGIHLRPRAGQVLALAIHELAVNAVEHGALSKSSGKIDVAWSVAREGTDTPLAITWKETGLRGIQEGSHEGFGTEVLTRTLSYELKATAMLAFEDDGLRVTLHFPLTERIGRVEED